MWKVMVSYINSPDKLVNVSSKHVTYVFRDKEKTALNFWLE